RDHRQDRGLLDMPIRRLAPLALLLAGCLSTTHRLELRVGEEHLIALEQGRTLHPNESAAEVRKSARSSCQSPVKSYNDLVCCDGVTNDAQHFFTPSTLGELRDALRQIDANEPAGHE